MIVCWKSIVVRIFIEIIEKTIDFSVVITPIFVIGATTITIIFPLTMVLFWATMAMLKVLK